MEAGKAECVEAEQKQCKNIMKSLAAVIQENKLIAVCNSEKVMHPCITAFTEISIKILIMATQTLCPTQRTKRLSRAATQVKSYFCCRQQGKGFETGAGSYFSLQLSWQNYSHLRRLLFLTRDKIVCVIATPEWSYNSRRQPRKIFETWADSCLSR